MIWLINVHNGKLEKFQNNFPRYAILSHTWGEDKDEIHFTDFKKGGRLYKRGPGRTKFDKCRQQAKADDFDYLWIDTCCIDKSNYTDYSEAITSMFSWYQMAGRCYAYLADVPDREDSTFHSDFLKSRWHGRGWTLQELLAPNDLVFYSQNWTKLGEKSSMSSMIEEATGIPAQFLSGFRGASVAQRMSWAAKRNTSRAEDMAYCLFGIFDVQIPVQYGEGSSAAFRRLQEAILKITPDASILAWGLDLEHNTVSQQPSIMRYGHILAASPQDFLNCGTVVPWENVPSRQSMELQGGYHHVQLPLYMTETGTTFGLLKCHSKSLKAGCIGIPLCLIEPEGEADEYMRPKESKAIHLFDLDPSHKPRTLRFRHASHPDDIANIDHRYGFKIEMPDSNKFTLFDVCPQDRWEKDKACIVTGVDFLRNDVQRTWIGLSDTQDDNSDFIVMLDFGVRSLQPRLECHIMLASGARSIGLDRIAREVSSLPNFSQFTGKKCASNGAYSLRVDCRIKRPRGYAVYEISFSESERQPECSTDITSEMNLVECDRELELCLEQALRMGPKVNEAAYSVQETRANIVRMNMRISSANSELKRLPQEVDLLSRALEPLHTERNSIQKEIWAILQTISSFGERLPTSAGEQRLMSWHSAVVQKLCRTLPAQHEEIESIPDEKERLFIRAVAIGHLGAMAYFLGQLDRATLRASTSHIAIPTAINSGNVETLDWLIELQFDINAQGSDGLTPLGRAASGGLLPVCVLLLNRGADVDLAGRDGLCPLALAVINNHIEVVGLLLSRHASTVKTDSGAGFSVLNIAACHDRVESVRLLIDAKAPLEARDKDGETPLTGAARRGHYAVIQEFLDHRADIEATNGNGSTPLAVAASEGHVGTASLLLRHGADMRSRNGNGRTPMLLAARQAHHHVVTLLLDRGDDIEAQDAWGFSALALAAREGFQQIAELLLQRYACIESRAKNERTPLIWAASKGHHQMVHLLLDYGADISARDNLKQTALVLAVRSKSAATAYALLDRSSSMQYPDIGLNDAVKSAINWARQKWTAFTHAQQVEFLKYTKDAASNIPEDKAKAVGHMVAIFEDAAIPHGRANSSNHTAANSHENVPHPSDPVNSSERIASGHFEWPANGEQTFNEPMAQSSGQGAPSQGGGVHGYGRRDDYERKRRYDGYHDNSQTNTYEYWDYDRRGGMPTFNEEGCASRIPFGPNLNSHKRPRTHQE